MILLKWFYLSCCVLINCTDIILSINNYCQNSAIFILYYLFQDCILGLEFSCHNSKGKKLWVCLLLEDWLQVFLLILGFCRKYLANEHWKKHQLYPLFVFKMSLKKNYVSKLLLISIGTYWENKVLMWLTCFKNLI